MPRFSIPRNRGSAFDDGFRRRQELFPAPNAQPFEHTAGDRLQPIRVNPYLIADRLIAQSATEAGKDFQLNRTKFDESSSLCSLRSCHNLSPLKINATFRPPRDNPFRLG
jgi:hypothetical protein